jgi:hypothetical protein
MKTELGRRLGQCQNVPRTLKTFMLLSWKCPFHWSRKRTLADNTLFQNGSIDTSFDPTLFTLDSTFNNAC